VPGERDLRVIANAPRDEQAAVWKKRRPKKGESVAWYEISRALQKRHMRAKHARLDEEIAQAFGIVWSEDLFAPADEDSRYTTQVDEFLAAQQVWLNQNLPENGIILGMDGYGQPKLRPKAQRLHGGKPRKTDRIGYYLHEHTGEIGTIAFRLPDTAAKPKHGAPTDEHMPAASKGPRPPVTKKGMALIGDLRTESLRQALGDATIDDHTLLGLLVLALGASNVNVLTPSGPIRASTGSPRSPLPTGPRWTTTTPDPGHERGQPGGKVSGDRFHPGGGRRLRAARHARQQCRLWDFVNLVSLWSRTPTRCHRLGGKLGGLTPRDERLVGRSPMRLRGDQVAARGEGVGDGGVDGEEALGRARANGGPSGLSRGRGGDASGQGASAGRALGGATLRISGTMAVAMTKQTTMTMKASAKVWVCASRQASDQSSFSAAP
jgi:hypothetical protein